MAILKVVSGPEEACRGIQSGMTLMLGGFGLCGIPENSIAELVKMGVNNLTRISNNAGVDDFDRVYMRQRQIKKMISSYVAKTMSSSAKCSRASWKWT